MIGKGGEEEGAKNVRVVVVLSVRAGAALARCERLHLRGVPPVVSLVLEERHVLQPSPLVTTQRELQVRSIVVGRLVPVGRPPPGIRRALCGGHLLASPPLGLEAAPPSAAPSEASSAGVGLALARAVASSVARAVASSVVRAIASSVASSVARAVASSVASSVARARCCRGSSSSGDLHQQPFRLLGVRPAGEIGALIRFVEVLSVKRSDNGKKNQIVKKRK